jgi:hypothetical protein
MVIILLMFSQLINLFGTEFVEGSYHQYRIILMDFVRRAAEFISEPAAEIARYKLLTF